MKPPSDEVVLDLLGLDSSTDIGRHIDQENEWLWKLRARLLTEVEQVEQRITQLTGIEEFR